MSSTSAEAPITFSTFVISLASSGLQHLGHTEHAAADLHLARQTLELLKILADKTKGNLDDEETRLLDAVQHELGEKYEAAVRS